MNDDESRAFYAMYGYLPRDEKSQNKKEAMMQRHSNAISSLAVKIKAFSDANTFFRIYHGETNSTRISDRKTDAVLDISCLKNIIDIDKSRKTAIVEPNVSMDALVAATLKKGLLPQVVPEFPGITVGGAFSGTAAESSSFKYGYFDKSVVRAEFLLANGTTVEASAEENADLFHGAVGACGTLGVGTLFEIQLIESPKYVQVRYIPTNSIPDALSKLRSHTDSLSAVDFVEAIMFSPTSGAVVVGKLTDTNDSDVPIVRFTRAKDPWFYLHVHESVAHERYAKCDTCRYSKPRDPYIKGQVVELIPVADYVFRYDRGAFWMGIYGQKPQFFNRLSRFLTNPLMRTRAMYKTMHHSGRSQSFIIQDLAIPQESAKEFLTWSDNTLHVYPIWLCPIKAETNVPLRISNGTLGCPNVINVGLWGLKTTAWPFYESPVGPAAFKRFIEDNRAIESKVHELGGLKWLYAHNYYTEEEFWSVYDKAKYDHLREKWCAQSLPNIWDKMRNDDPEYVEKHPFWKSVIFTLLGRDHLLS
ncbi:Delta(24)-sterol reductase [Colletotrichum sidae]|uniref:Delta(24)-sterol reductase n=1 Tax=Colletotrichum sidae TaxID=1347389 RepID=A0A4R8TM36_9PEZI|nr:Delta(24)-sterol reductase [Colletotrichum sidae]